MSHELLFESLHLTLHHSIDHILTDVRLLEPIGKHRSEHISPSKGKRSKKRKRDSDSAESHQEPKSDPPPPPQISKHITVGLNSTSRRLESLVEPVFSASTSENAKKPSQAHSPLAVIFLTQPVSSLQYSHLPTLVAFTAASRAGGFAPRFVALDAAAEQKLKTALGIPRVSVLGVLSDAPGAAPLFGYVRHNVSPLDIPWVKEATQGKWLGTKISVEVPGE
jgi:ribonuclease P/MRP protein subunit POP3